MRVLLYALILIASGSVRADNVLLMYEPDVSREEIESKLTSFGLTVASYWKSIHGGHIIVPCREAERWVRVLNEVKGVLVAEHDFLVSTASGSPTLIPTCVPQTEAIYDDESETLAIPQLHLDGEIYRIKLGPPFNIQEIEFVGELTIYQY
ncbi:MAG: hypothetical protein Q7U82_16160 [Gammaproteobacteria bacterium]|nr:hypothetical protein [Gammaproteobacteria bacterium]